MNRDNTFTYLFIASDSSAVTMVHPADGPSFGVATGNNKISKV